MGLAGSGSWRLDFEVREDTRVALFLRDRLGIASAEHVPPLTPKVDAGDSQMRSAAGAKISTDWDSWWAVISRTRIHPSGVAFEDVPPSLQQAVDALSQEALEWFTAQQHVWVQPQRQGDLEIANGAVQDAAFDLGVSASALHADTQLLLVEGIWWSRPAPGVLLYSAAVLEDPVLLRGLLRDTFASSLS